MLTSINLNALPFMGSCDSTRAQMASKQMNQALTHPNCDAPYLVSNEYRNLLKTSDSGVLMAEDSGQVIFNNNDIIIVYYENLKDILVRKIPLYKNTSEIFGSKLRFSLPTGTNFKQNDIIYSYDCFRNGFPSFGYNVMTGYFNFFGYNFEDSMVISESFAEKAQSVYTEKVYIPIYEYTVLQPLFYNDENSNIYFPSIGQKINKDGLICSQLKANLDDNASIADQKNRMMMLFDNLNISDLINIQKSQNLSQFSIDEYKSKIKEGRIVNIKVHKVNKNATLIDLNLSKKLNQMHQEHIDNNLVEQYNELNINCGDEFAKQVAKSHLIYFNDLKTTNRNSLMKHANYLLEFDIAKETQCYDGDKLCNRYAGKGVISLTLPDELRPLAVKSNKPIDCVFNSFGVFSRMNISQILEGIVQKNAMYCEEEIINGNIDKLNELNENVIKHLNDHEYYNQVKNLVKDLNKDEDLRNQFINNVKENGLTIEAPAFKEINIKEIINKSPNIREPILIKKECLQYMKAKLKVDLPFEMKDTYINNIFCAPIYTMRLHKIADDVVSARDLGKYKFVTKQPLKGKANEGGRRLGQMEIEALIGHGCIKALKELFTVKSDCIDEKSQLIEQLMEKGEYHMNKNTKVEGGTKKVVQTMIEFLND